ncbi:MAG: M4 family metallopeptidase [Rhodanobacteraceae bacterium]|nr:M4 family metallopeptidase [Rhodanobacteraceae bacterium]
MKFSSSTKILLYLATGIAGIADVNAAVQTDLSRADITTLNANRTGFNGGQPTITGWQLNNLRIAPAVDEQSTWSLEAQSERLKGKASTYSYQQKYYGMPVYGADILFSVQDHWITWPSQVNIGSFNRVMGNVVSGIKSDIPTIAQGPYAGDAVIARAEELVHGVRPASTFVEVTEKTRIVFVDDSSRARLAQYVRLRIDYASQNKVVSAVVIVDEFSGAQLLKWDDTRNLSGVPVKGTGPGGNLKTGKYTWGATSGYDYLPIYKDSTSSSRCYLENPDVRVTIAYDYKGNTPGSPSVSFTCPNNIDLSLNGGFGVTNDAMYFAQNAIDMFKAYMASPWSTQLLVAVNTIRTGAIAAFDPTVGVVTLGMGDADNYPEMGADTLGHEIGHAFFARWILGSGVMYIGASGGVEESFADLSGEASEYFWKSKNSAWSVKNDFIVGDELRKNSNGHFRDMCDPPRDGDSYDDINDVTNATDAHYSSGPVNKASCLLAKTPGWNTKMVFELFSFAIANRLLTSSRLNTFISGNQKRAYNNTACAFQHAAWFHSYPETDVARAFAAVGAYCGGLFAKVAESVDSSGRVNTAVFETRDVAFTPNSTFELAVPADYVVVGGGVEGMSTRAANYREGSYVAAAYPKDDYSAWVVSTSGAASPLPSPPTYARAWAIGLKVSGMTPAQLRQNLITVKKTAAPGTYSSATLPPGYVLVGGGIKVDAGPTPPRLAYMSLPVENVWVVGSSTVGASAAAGSVTAYAVGLKQSVSLPGVTVPVTFTSNYITKGGSSTDSYFASGTVSLREPSASGYALVACGGKIRDTNLSSDNEQTWATSIRPYVDQQSTGSVLGCSISGMKSSQLGGHSVSSFALLLKSP